MTAVEKVCLAVSVSSFLVSLVCLLFVARTRRHQAAVLAMRVDIDRFARIEESVVRSVMEEGGDYSVESKLRTVERLRNAGLTPSSAVAEAQRLHKRKVSG